MSSSKLLAGAAVLVALAAAPAAFAASDSDIQGLQAAKLSLSDAVAKVQKESHGRAIFARFDMHDGAGNYVVTVVTPGGKKDVFDVDPKNGQATKAAVTNSGSSSEDSAQTVANAKVGLVRAIHRAGLEQGGKPMMASIGTDNGKPAYKVQMINGGKSIMVWVNANTGEMMNAPKIGPFTAPAIFQ